MITPHDLKKPRKVFYLAVIIAALAAGILLSFYIYTKIDAGQKSHMMDRAKTISEMIPKEDLLALSGSEEDLSNPHYLKLKELLTKVREVNGDIRFVYILNQNSAGEIFFAVDSEYPDSEDYSPPGEVYYEASELLRQTISDGVSRSEGPLRDRWGVWVSSHAAIKDENGKVLALVGLDIPAREYIYTSATYASIPLFLSLIIIIISLFSKSKREREIKNLEFKEEMLSIASHEIRSPLLGIKWAFDSILKTDAPISEEEKESTLKTIYENCLKLIANTNNMLSTKALEDGGKKVLHIEKVEVRPFLEDVSASLELNSKQHEIKIILDPSVEGKSANFDKQDMHHVFFNLLSNAIKYSPAHSEIRISYNYQNKNHVFEIKDQGKGMEKSEALHIFDGYYRASNAVKSNEAGTGLGLYLSKKIVEAHRGVISVSSEPGKGSVFKVEIPE